MDSPTDGAPRLQDNQAVTQDFQMYGGDSCRKGSKHVPSEASIVDVDAGNSVIPNGLKSITSKFNNDLIQSEKD